MTILKANSLIYVDSMCCFVDSVLEVHMLGLAHNATDCYNNTEGELLMLDIVETFLGLGEDSTHASM